LFKRPLPELLKTEVFQEIYKVLNEDNATTLMVGGVVRDFLQGKLENATSVDIDLATTLLPDETTKRCKAAGFKVVPIGLDHGTVMATKDGEKFEITTLREDLSTDGRHAEVGFTTDFERDAGRRDFTFNALYMDNKGQITDFFEGIDDLEKGKVRFVGAPTKRLEEDWLRALRYFRFYARLNKCARPDDETLHALANAAEHMQKLSAERKTTEVLKIMAAPQAEAACELMCELGYMKALGLEKFDLDALKNWRQNSSEALIKWGVENIGLLNLIAAIWKPTRPQRVGEQLAENPHFKFSNAEKQQMQNLAPYHMRELNYRNPTYSAFKLGAENAQILFHLAALHSFDKRKTPVLAHETPQADITGQDLKKEGLKDGKALGNALAELQHWGMWYGKNKKADYLEHFKKLKKTPASILVVPDVHGNVDALKALMDSPFGKDARAILSLGDYLDASDEDLTKTRIIETAEYMAELLENDHRFIMVRANHEQINAKMMRKALLQDQTPSEFVTPNKHNIMLLKELEKLSPKAQKDYMARQLDMFVQRSVDGVRIALPTGETLGFTHGGWHVDIEDPASKVSTFAVGSQRLETMNFKIRNMPKHARYEAMWGHWLAVPEDQGRPDTAHLNMPPEGYTLIVGHHFTRRKNTLPEKTGNVIFADTGSGKGGQLTALRIFVDCGTIDVISPSYEKGAKGGFAATPLKATPHIVPFKRRIPTSGNGKSA